MLKLTTLKDKQIIKQVIAITINISNVSQFPLSKIDVYINEVFVGSSKKSPFSFSFVPSNLDNLKKQNRLKIIGYDSVFNRGEAELVFNVNI